MKRDMEEPEKAKSPPWYEVSVSKAGPSLKQAVEQTEEYRQRLNLLYEVGKKVGSVPDLSKLLDQIMGMTCRSLRSGAASLLLIDRGSQELYFEVAAGGAGSTLRQLRLGMDAGIAGWVARHVRSAIVNDVAQDPRFNREIDKATGFVTRSILAVPLVMAGEVIGVLEVLNKVDAAGFNEQDQEVLMSLASMAAVAISNARMHEAVIEGYKSTVRALAAAIDAKDPYTCGHSQRVMEYSLVTAESLGMPAEAVQAIEFGGMLHDIGKIGIHDSILLKSGSLTAEEWSAMVKHPAIGAHIIDGIPFLKSCRNIVLYHHERYDGSGYPEGLSGENIPSGARLLSVADAFDAITTDRAYRAAQPPAIALKVLERLAGTQFCPVAVQAFVASYRKRQRRQTDKPALV